MQSLAYGSKPVECKKLGWSGTMVFETHIGKLDIEQLTLLRDEIVRSALLVPDERLHNRLFHLYVDFGYAHDLRYV